LQDRAYRHHKPSFLSARMVSRNL